MTKQTEALKLALEALEYIEHNYMSLPAPAEKAITALREALAEQPAQQEPDELRHIGEQDCLLDVDEKAWRSLVENRGGCRCHISPPCGACSNPISEEEMNEVGYTYTPPQPAQRKPLTDEQIESLWDHGMYVHCSGITALRAITRAIEAKLNEKNT